MWHFVSGAQAPLTLTLVDELFSVHKSTEKNGNSREIVESQGQTPRRARFGTCEISRQPNPDRLDFARWNYAALRNHARGSSAVARYRSLFIAWFTRCSFMMYNGRGNRDTPTGELFLFGFFEFILFTTHFSFTFQILLINFTAYDSFFFIHIYDESKKDWGRKILRNNFKLLFLQIFFFILIILRIHIIRYEHTLYEKKLNFRNFIIFLSIHSLKCNVHRVPILSTLLLITSPFILYSPYFTFSFYYRGSRGKCEIVGEQRRAA